MGHNSADAVHISVEAMKLALADRDVYYADPHFAQVPLKELLAPKYAELRRGLIDPKHASLVQRPGDPVRGVAELASFDPRVGDWVTVGDDEEPPLRAQVIRREGNRVSVQLRLQSAPHAVA